MRELLIDCITTWSCSPIIGVIFIMFFQMSGIWRYNTFKNINGQIYEFQRLLLFSKFVILLAALMNYSRQIRGHFLQN